MNALRRLIMEATVKQATKTDKTNFRRNVTIMEDPVIKHWTVGEGKMPKWYKAKSNGEVGASATDSGGKKVELLLCGVMMFSFPQRNQDLLQDPNIWIADSAATVHTTADKQGFHSLEKAIDADSIMMGNGLAEKASL
jgi:hypothetical protein